ncbi:hypothetical protein MRB53_038932 [Persea americana]|nr:hypothetical protein MRB53_038932 [Persea americana]
MFDPTAGRASDDPPSIARGHGRRCRKRFGRVGAQTRDSQRPAPNGGLSACAREQVGDMERQKGPFRTLTTGVGGLLPNQTTPVNRSCYRHHISTRALCPDRPSRHSLWSSHTDAASFVSSRPMQALLAWTLQMCFWSDPCASRDLKQHTRHLLQYCHSLSTNKGGTAHPSSIVSISSPTAASLPSGSTTTLTVALPGDCYTSISDLIPCDTSIGQAQFVTQGRPAFRATTPCEPTLRVHNSTSCDYSSPSTGLEGSTPSGCLPRFLD